ncbi:hypothetical protein BGX31_001042, partial [Mortierella sp. GBA43]
MHKVQVGTQETQITTQEGQVGTQETQVATQEGQIAMQDFQVAKDITLSANQLEQFICLTNSLDCGIIKLAAFAEWSGFRNKTTIMKNYNALSVSNAVHADVRELMKKLRNSTTEDRAMLAFLRTLKHVKKRKGSHNKPPRALPQKQPSSSASSSTETSDSDFQAPVSKKNRVMDYLECGSLSIETLVSQAGHFKVGDDEFDLTAKLIEERKALVDDTSVLKAKDISKRLALSYIFEEDFLSLVGVNESVRSSIFPVVKYQREQNAQEVAQDEVDRQFITYFADLAARNASQTELKKSLGEYSDNPTPFVKGLIVQLIQSDNIWLRREPSWSEASYQASCVDPVLDGLFSDMELEKHLSRTRLPTESSYKENLEPDYMRTFDKLVVVVAEVKPLGTAKPKLDEDRGKLYCSMKLSLNMLLRNGVNDPTIVGVLVQEGNIIFVIMNLKYEAMYFPVKHGFCKAPSDRMGFGSLRSGLPIFSAIREIVSDTVEKIRFKSSG